MKYEKKPKKAASSFAPKKRKKKLVTKPVKVTEDELPEITEKVSEKVPAKEPVEPEHVGFEVVGKWSGLDQCLELQE